jgi:hypothetical protein
MGKKSGPAAPPPPDPVATANAQAGVNRDTAITQANLNRVDQITPQGSLTYNNKGTWEDGTPRYEQIMTYSPEQQALYEQQNRIAQALGTTAEGGLGRVNDTLGRSFDFSGATPLRNIGGPAPVDLQDSLGNTDFNQTSSAAADAVYKQLASRLDPQYSQLENDTRTRLINSGITENSDAFRREMDNFSRSRTDAYNTAGNTSVLTGLEAQNQGFNQALAAGNFTNNARLSEAGYNRNDEIQSTTFNNDVRQREIEEATYLRNLPLNDIAALLGTGGGVQAPNFGPVSQVGVAAPDLMGATYKNYDAAMQQWQTAQNNRSQGLGSIFGLAGSLGSAAIMASDRRIKHAIKRVGTLANGIATYVFSYIGETARHFGVMAQEVLNVMPEAVGTADNGYMYVDYRKLGLC